MANETIKYDEKIKKILQDKGKSMLKNFIAFLYNDEKVII